MTLKQFERDWIAQQAKKNKAEIEHELRLIKAKELSDELMALNRALEISDRLMKARR